jgi:hypothetical protein
MDDAALISKKDVLAETGISYGQLYRWKRKGLIPEGWFVRRSTFTGQETFFPREKILERIAQILELKDNHALDELARALGEPFRPDRRIDFETLDRLSWTEERLLVACGLARSTTPPTLGQALCLGVMHGLRAVVRESELPLVRATLEAQPLEPLIEPGPADATTLFLLRVPVANAEGSAIVVGAESTRFDPRLQVVATVDLRAVLERIQLDLT